MKTRLDNMIKASDIIYELERIEKEIDNVHTDALKYATLNPELHDNLIKQMLLNRQLSDALKDKYNLIINSLII